MNDAVPSIDARLADTPLDVAAQRVSFGTGLYLVTLTGGGTVPSGGLSLPCVRIDPLPPTPDAPGRAFVSCLSDGQWLMSDAQSAFLRIEGGRAILVLTTYNAAGAGQSPQVRIRLVRDAMAAAGLITGGRSTTDASSSALSVAVAATYAGEVSFTAGDWAELAEREPIETLAIRLGPLHSGLTLEYQALFGVDWVSPWAVAPETCGSRGLGVPLLGLRVQLSGAGSEAYRLLVSGRFGGLEVGPVGSGELLSAGEAPLTALRVELVAAPRERRTRTRRLNRPADE